MSPSPFRRSPGRAGTLLTAFGAAALLLAATGCSALGGSDAPAESGGDAPAGAVEKPDLNVGVLPIVDVAAIQRAKAAGYFEAEGLNVTLTEVESGAVALPAMIAGDLDLTWTNWTSVIKAESEKIADLRVINATYQAAPNSFLLLTRPDGGIATPADIAGKKVAINAPGSITELLAKSAIQANGVDPASVTYVPIPFPQMGQALQTGQVDAITVLEPFLTDAERTTGAVTLLDAASGPTSEIPIAGMATKAEFAEQNPNTIAAFQRAVSKSQAEMADRAIVEQTLPTYTKITPDTAPLLNLGTWPATIDVTSMQRVSDLMTQYGLLPAPFDVTPLLADLTTG